MKINTVKKVITTKETKDSRFMKLGNLAGAKEFISKLTNGRVSERQNERTIAYLRAKGIVFYDEWSKEHCLIIEEMESNKIAVLDALREGLRYV